VNAETGVLIYVLRSKGEGKKIDTPGGNRKGIHSSANIIE